MADWLRVGFGKVWRDIEGLFSEIDIQSDIDTVNEAQVGEIEDRAE